MNKIIPNILKSLELLSHKLKTELLSEKDKNEMKEEIEEFATDIKKLENTINLVPNISKIEDYTEIIVHLYQYLGDVVQDLENIHEITTIAVQRYAEKFLKNDL